MAADVFARIQGNFGQKHKDFDYATKIKEVPLRLHKNIRSMEHALGIPKSILHQRILCVHNLCLCEIIGQAPYNFLFELPPRDDFLLQV